MGGYSGGQGNSLQNSSAASAASGDINSTTTTGAQTFNFNAPAKGFTSDTYGKFIVGLVVVALLIAAAAWAKKQRRST